MNKLYKYIGISLIILLIAAIILIFINHPYFVYKKEIDLTRNFWVSLIQEKMPTIDENIFLSERFTNDIDNAFQFFKIWFYEFSPDKPDINLLDFESAGLISSELNYSKDSIPIGITFRYGTESQRLQMTIIHKGDSTYLDPHLSLDNCLWSPDMNEDGHLNDLDIEIIESNK